jgi:hypothetical protein
MLRRSRSLPLATLILLLAACGPPRQLPAPAPDHVTTVLHDGTELRLTRPDENSNFTVTAMADPLWAALMDSYTALGIAPTLVDRAGGRYGNAGFVMPRRLAERRIGEYFDCGQSLTGPRVEAGRLLASVMSTISPAGNGTMRVDTRVTSTLRLNEGTSSNTMTCASTGALETALRAGVEQRLAPRR